MFVRSAAKTSLGLHAPVLVGRVLKLGSVFHVRWLFMVSIWPLLAERLHGDLVASY